MVDTGIRSLLHREVRESAETGSEPDQVPKCADSKCAAISIMSQGFGLVPSGYLSYFPNLTIAQTID